MPRSTFRAQIAVLLLLWKALVPAIAAIHPRSRGVCFPNHNSVNRRPANNHKMVQADRNSIEKKYADRLASLKTKISAVIPSPKGSNDEKNSFIELAEHDDLLAELVVLQEATPRGLADFIVSTDDNDDLFPAERQNLIDQHLLGNPDLMKRMLRADGAKNGRYGPAIRIYQEIKTQRGDDDIVQASKHPVLDRLALAVALEHADPMPQNNPKKPDHDMDTIIDPVRRYLNYALAYLQGELDSGFEVLTVWELRMVVDGNEPDEVAAWGRSMLRNLRPDHILSKNENWRYIMLVRTEVRYGTEGVKHDLPELQQYQNILMNGGVCGRRAFIGRFILRAFGIPTAARPSKGHGALCHWTLDNGWVVNLGGNWGAGWTKTRYKEDVDFLATTQARCYDSEAYWRVKRAQWIGDVQGEKPIYGAHDKAEAGPWYGLSLEIQQEIIDRKKPGAANPPLPKNHITTLAQNIEAKPLAKDAKAISYSSQSGEIVIHAASFENPRKTKDVHVMPSFDHGGGTLQIYLPPFEAQGLTVLRGGTWKQDATVIYSGWRLKSGGYGKYHDWGFRVALGLGDDDDSHDRKDMTLHISDTDQSIEFVYIKPGTFLMGGEATKDGRFECVEVPKHEVKITRGYFLGKFPVTQAQYEAVIGSNPSKSTKAPTCPVDNIGEEDALTFCRKVTEVAGRDVRLPTEAEWEYACRSGCGDSKWFFGDSAVPLGDYAWFKGNSGGKSHPVGQKKPNPWGLYDMYGNVVERCSDKYDQDYYGTKDARVDPTGPSQGIKSLFEYKINATTAGSYNLTGKVVTVNYQQRLTLSVNGSKDKTTIDMPFTLGEWNQFAPVRISLKKGENMLRFWRDRPPQYALVIKEFKLTPAA